MDGCHIDTNIMSLDSLRFYEAYWLPNKFGFDKRKVHFSSLILTEQMTREKALKRLQEPSV